MNLPNSELDALKKDADYLSPFVATYAPAKDDYGQQASKLKHVQLECNVPLDKAGGRAFLSGNGDLFYSPNCSRAVEVPPPLDYGMNPFIPEIRSTPTDADISHQHHRSRSYWDLDVNSYRTPTWWTDWFGWIAFLQKEDNEFDVATLFCCLKLPLTCYIPEDELPEDLDDESGFKTVGGFMLVPSEQENWLRLDNQIYYACLKLKEEFGIDAFLPSRPWIMGYLQPHKRHGTFNLCLSKSRKWFKVYLTLLSYLIAASETREKLAFPIPAPGVESLHWKDVLLSSGQRYGVTQWWIDFLLETTVIPCPTNRVERVGIFLHLNDSNPYHVKQPAPSWFCAYNVPIWYPWTTNQSKDKTLSHLAPLPHQLQMATTFLSKSPSLQEKDVLNKNSHAGPSTKKMDEFFKLRGERNRRIEAKETALNRKRRLDRERQKPTKSAAMFLWTENDHGEYESNPVPKRERDSYFKIYNEKTQMRYDSFHSEWHICELWGDDLVDEDFEAFYAGDLRDREPPAPPDVDHGAVLDGDEWEDRAGDDERNGTVSHGTTSPSIEDLFEGEILNVTSKFFGYTPTLPLPNACIVKDEASRKKICRWLGIEWNKVQNHHAVFERPAVAAAIDFFQRLAQGPQGQISPDECDLDPKNRHAVTHIPLFKYFREVTSNQGTRLFMLDLREKRQAAWYLALKYASDVAVVCRLALNKHLTEYDVVEFLIQNGIPFHTLLPTSAVSRTSITPQPPPPPFRPKDYRFGANDYLSYRERCNSILRQPRGRAALMNGGLMWRLAVAIVPWENVYRGPSGWSTNPKEVIVVVDSVTSLELIDDRLSETEQDALCGTYHCQTGQKNSDQVSISSWYMPPQLYSRSAQDFGRWTGYSEKVFHLVDRIYSSDQQHLELTSKPRTKSLWKNQARDGGNRRALLLTDRKVLELLSRSL